MSDFLWRMINERRMKKGCRLSATMFTKYKVLFNQGPAGNMLSGQGYMIHK